MPEASTSQFERVSSPKHFVAALASALRVLALRPWSVLVPLVVTAVAVVIAADVIRELVGESSYSIGFSILVTALQVFVTSVVAARLSLTLKNALVGERREAPSPEPDEGLGASHLLAAAAIAGLSAALVYLLIGPLGYALGARALIGPPLLAHAIVLERTTLQEGWRRTRERLRGNALRMSVYLSCAALLAVLVEDMALFLVYRIARGSFSGSALGWGLELTRGLLLGAGLSFMTAVGFVAYLEARTRHDGLTADELREAPAEVAPEEK